VQRFLNFLAETAPRRIDNPSVGFPHLGWNTENSTAGLDDIRFGVIRRDFGDAASISQSGESEKYKFPSKKEICMIKQETRKILPEYYKSRASRCVFNVANIIAICNYRFREANRRLHR